ncbi:TRAP transporter small permease [Roseomonas sp. NAR14]|uniref:TRAP transporter small permease protein n=1 Tax=Roseomonas acroporae TaxID=2937791 RepID=A0A9X1Y999_9PROT|nr:TRAP transporter small permease [Roseomonas acroporae]MCK8785868.1 TRAP transporter small permease [Roseomonas acroporae]
MRRAAGGLHAPVHAALDLLCRAALWLSGIALLAMTVVVAWSVFGRFVLNDTPAWGESLALLLLGWVILGAAAAGVRENFHMGFETLRDLLPAPVAAFCMGLSDALVTMFGAAMAWYGGELALGVWDATLPALELPGAVEYLPLVVGGLLIALFGAERLLTRLATGAAPAVATAEHTILTDA